MNSDSPLFLFRSERAQISVAEVTFHPASSIRPCYLQRTMAAKRKRCGATAGASKADREAAATRAPGRHLTQAPGGPPRGRPAATAYTALGRGVGKPRAQARLIKVELRLPAASSTRLVQVLDLLSTAPSTRFLRATARTLPQLHPIDYAHLSHQPSHSINVCCPSPDVCRLSR